MNDFKTTEQWLSAFRSNVKNVHPIRLDNHQLSPLERDRITASIQDFQLGESSEGHILRKQARSFAQRYQVSCYPDLMDYFILEENRHSVYLARFMKQHRIPKKKKTLNDSVFRFFRHLLGVELGLRILITAEIIALAYYSSLKEATRSKVLKGICLHMLTEEQVHTRFQMQHIQFMNQQKSKTLSKLCDKLHYTFIFFVGLAVWKEHKAVLKMKFTFRGFIRFSLKNFNEVLSLGHRDGIQMIQNRKEENHAA